MEWCRGGETSSADNGGSRGKMPTYETMRLLCNGLLGIAQQRFGFSFE